MQRDFAVVDRLLVEDSFDRAPFGATTDTDEITGTFEYPPAETSLTRRGRVTAEEQFTGQAFRYCTILGDRWVFADEFDRAIEPYEKALALRPEEPVSRNNAAVAHTFARLGDISAHRLRAIQIHLGTLEHHAAGLGRVGDDAEQPGQRLE